MQSALLSLHIIDVFQMTELLCRTFFFNEQEKKYVSFYLNENLKPQVRIGSSSGHVVLNDLQWFIPVTFKSNILKNEVHELGDSRHTPVSVMRTVHTHYEWEQWSISMQNKLVKTDGFS